jgi:protein MAK11
LSVPSKDSSRDSTELLSVSTEDGRILFYSTGPESSIPTPTSTTSAIPPASLIAQLGGPSTPSTTRIKCYKLLILEASFIAITGSSDGSVRIWRVQYSELQPPSAESPKVKGTKSRSERNEDFTNGTADTNGTSNGRTTDAGKIKQVGILLGTCETGNRITCLEAFVLDGIAESDQQEEEARSDFEDEGSSGGSER